MARIGSSFIAEDLALSSGWNHVAVTFDSPDLIFYLNGEPSDSQTLSGVNTNADPYVYARIGKGSDDKGEYFEGLIDNVMIFDRALSVEEIVALADAAGDNVLSVAKKTVKISVKNSSLLRLTSNFYLLSSYFNLTTDYRGYQYSYDYENRLIEVKDSDDTSIVTYAYDALGRRIQKDDKIAGEKTRYYNNHDWQVLAEYDDSDVHQRSYIYGSYIDEVLVMVDPIAAEDYYFAHNHLYSPTALLDDTGDIIERCDYDAYGRPYFMEPNFVLYETQNSNYNNPYLFTGRRVDFLDNGKLTLQYSRNRYYDYHTGRWLTPDPMKYIDGLNLYEYARGMPMFYLDPYGYWSLWETMKDIGEDIWELRGEIGVVVIGVGAGTGLLLSAPFTGGAIVAGGIVLIFTDIGVTWIFAEDVVEPAKVLGDLYQSELEKLYWGVHNFLGQ